MVLVSPKAGTAIQARADAEIQTEPRQSITDKPHKLRYNYNMKTTPTTSPGSIAQSMSALVKMVRLRRTEDAIYWFKHIHALFPADHFRLYRRMLIIGAEDCINVEVQSQVYEWYKRALSSKNSESVLNLGCYLLARICATENWWQQDSGQRYILSWAIAEIEQNSRTITHTSEEQLEILMDMALKEFAINCKSDGPKKVNPEVFIQHMLFRRNNGNHADYANAMVSAATKLGLIHCRATAQTFASNGKILGKQDDNWLGQALWRLCGLPLGEAPILPLEDVDMLIAKANNRLETPEVPPAYTQDGIHCSGKDRRFAGMLPSMVGCCNMFNLKGRLDPSDQWPNHTTDNNVLKETLNDY
jgi:hypothetical protein